MALPQPLDPGSTAPIFEFAAAGQTVRSDALVGPCLLYFYPKDDTPGCTTQACAIRDAWSEFEAAGLTVVGVSKDPETYHEKFTNKYQLPFPLIADTELALAQAFGVYGEKKFMGRVYDSVHRMSFLIAADGTILKTYPKVKPDLHAAEVLKDLKENQK